MEVESMNYMNDDDIRKRVFKFNIINIFLLGLKEQE